MAKGRRGRTQRLQVEGHGAIQSRVGIDDPITLGADGSILVNTGKLQPPEKVYDADVAWLKRGRGYVSLFFGKQNPDAPDRLRTRLEVKYAPEAFVRHLWRNSREFHETTREILKTWPEDPLLVPIDGSSMAADRDHSEWANFDYMARSGSHGTIDFFLLPAGGIAKFVHGQGSAGLVMRPVVQVLLTVHELLRFLDAADALVNDVKRYLPPEAAANG